MARWSGVDEPDDPLRADDPLVGAEHEDVLLGSGAADDDDPAAEYADTGQEDVDDSPVSGAVLDDRPTTKLPPVVVAAPAPEVQGRWAGAAPWAVFAAVAVVVITATTTLASWLQGPTAERQSFTGLIQSPPTSSVAPVAPAEPAPPPPTPEPEPQPTPEAKPDPDPAPAARPTERPRPTRAQPAAPPPAATVNAPASRTPKPQAEPPATSSAAQAASGAEADTAERDSENDSADADAAKPADEDEGGSDE